MRRDGLLRCARNDGFETCVELSRRVAPEALSGSSAPQRGRGECRVHRKSPGIPARNGFTAYVVISPAIGLFCHRRLRKSLSANLTPASRRQDHTILPSASKALSSEAPLAATASSPASVTIAIRPLSGVDVGGYKVICGFGKTEYFFGRDWTDRNSLIRLEKLDFTRKCKRRAGDRRSDQPHGYVKLWNGSGSFCSVCQSKSYRSPAGQLSGNLTRK